MAVINEHLILYTDLEIGSLVQAFALKEIKNIAYNSFGFEVLTFFGPARGSNYYTPTVQ